MMNGNEIRKGIKRELENLGLIMARKLNDNTLNKVAVPYCSKLKNDEFIIDIQYYLYDDDVTKELNYYINKLKAKYSLNEKSKHVRKMDNGLQAVFLRLSTKK